MPQTEDIIINVDLVGATGANKDVDQLTKSLNKNTKATDDAEASTESYNNSLVDAAKDTQIFGVSINSLSKSFTAVTSTLKGVNTGLKAFKIALAATGIGAIVLALGSLVALLTQTQEGMDFVSKAINGIKTAIDVVIDRFIEFGEGMVKFFSGDFKEGITQMTESFKGLGDEIKEEIQISNDLTDAFNRLEQAKIDNIVADAKARAEAEKLKAIVEDQTLTLGERIRASRQFEQIETQRANKAIEIAAEELRILQERNELGTSTREDLRAEAEAEAVLFQLREESAARQLEQANKRRELQKQLNAENTAEETATAAEVVKINYEANTEIEKSDLDLHFKRLQLKRDELAASAAKSQSEIELARVEAEQKAALTANLANAIAGLLGQESEAGKAFAIAAATINMFEAVSKANTLAPPASFIAIATAIATGLKAIRDIKGVPLPKVTIAETPFADGGPIDGPSHSRGGVWLNAEGGEYIINKSAMRDPVNRAIAESINSGQQSRGHIFRQGGTVQTPGALDLFNIESAIQDNRAILVLEDLDRAQTGVQVSQEIATLR